MTHLEFVDKLQETGISVQGTDREHGVKTFPIYGAFDTNNIIYKNRQLRWEKPDTRDPLECLIKTAIDMDGWKHSWHTDIIPENYDKFTAIIQQKIIDRAEEIKKLVTVYFQIGYEQSKK